ncbi:MAG TPA: hypothetical protein VM243_14600 [Phycisphaerae bacterium]|nr:hypothetical protein [Phycisphaerae bacterium]
MHQSQDDKPCLGPEDVLSGPQIERLALAGENNVGDKVGNVCGRTGLETRRPTNRAGLKATGANAEFG